MSGRLQLAWLLDERALHPERDELAFYVWGLTGERDVTAAQRVRRTRAPPRPWPAYAGGPPCPGSPLAQVADGEAWGATALAGFRPIPALELDLGINRLHTLPDGGVDQ